MPVPVETPTSFLRPPKIIFDLHKLPELPLTEDRETNTDILDKADQFCNTLIVNLESREVLTDPYYLEPIRIIERVIEYVPSPPMEGRSIGT